MSVSDAKEVLNDYSPRIGWGGAHLDTLDATLKALLDQIYKDAPMVGSVTMNGTGTTPVTFAALGFPDMANADYQVMAILSGTAQGSIAGKGLSINSKTTSGFDLVCEDATATDDVDLIIVGASA